MPPGAHPAHVLRAVAQGDRGEPQDLRSHGQGAARERYAPLRRIFRATGRVDSANSGRPRLAMKDHADFSGGSQDESIEATAAAWLAERDDGLTEQEERDF